MKLCCFRFDADTHACVSIGMPRLVELGNRLGVKFTFFVNMGRAFDPGLTLLKTARRLFASKRRDALSTASKLGRWNALKATVLNPRAGLSKPAALLSAVRSGNEIGLHGGRNHARWEHSAHHWTKARLRHEIAWGLTWMKRCGLPTPTSFASPAWNSPLNLPPVLRSFGFRTLADLYNSCSEEVCFSEGLQSLPTNIHHGTSSAGYLEAMHLQGCTTRQIIANFRRQLRTKTSLAVVYDHPFFAGVHALAQVDALIQTALEEDYRVVTVQEAADALSPQAGFRV